MNGHNYNGRSGQLGHMGRLGASITASVPRGRPYRAEQSSGLFDVPTMEDAMAMQANPFAPRMYAQSPAVSYEPLPMIPGVRLRSHVPVERYGIGWFGVFVTWVVTVSLGCLLAANLTGHVRHLTLVGSSSVGSVAKPPAPPVTSPPSAAPAAPIAAAPVAGTVTTPSALTVAMPTAATRPASPPLPEVGVADLPRAPALASAAAPRHHGRSAAVAWRAPKHSAPAAAPAQDDDDTDEADPPAEAPAPKPAPVAAKRAVSAPDSDATESATAAPPPKAEPAPAPAPPKPAPKVTFAAGSLEDMIQKAVEKEQKQLHKK
jgi:hypothetical protein